MNVYTHLYCRWLKIKYQLPQWRDLFNFYHTPINLRVCSDGTFKEHLTNGTSIRRVIFCTDVGHSNKHIGEQAVRRIWFPNSKLSEIHVLKNDALTSTRFSHFSLDNIIQLQKMTYQLLKPFNYIFWNIKTWVIPFFPPWKHVYLCLAFNVYKVIKKLIGSTCS